MRKEYIIIGSDNFWYGLCDTLKEAKEIVENAQSNISDFANPETGRCQIAPPETFYIYKGEEVEEIDND